MKIGDIVITPHGKGTIKDVEEYSRLSTNRFGIELDINPFDYPIVYYWTNEITKDDNA